MVLLQRQLPSVAGKEQPWYRVGGAGKLPIGQAARRPAPLPPCRGTRMDFKGVECLKVFEDLSLQVLIHPCC